MSPLTTTEKGLTDIVDGITGGLLNTIVLGITTGGSIVIVEGIDIGPNGPMSRQGNTIGGRLILAAIFGSNSIKISSKSGIESKVTFKSCGKNCTSPSFTRLRATSLFTVWQLLLSTVIIGSIVEFGG